MLEVVNGAACYPGGEWLFRGLSFGVGDGEFCVVLGPNGTGKTSLMRCILGIQSLNEGTIHRPANIAHVPQSLEVLFDFSVLDIVLMGATASRPGLFTLPRRADYQRAHGALEDLGINGLHTRPFASLSGGERQLALLARAMATGSRLILLDEPTAALDIGNEELVLSMLTRLRRRGCSVVMSSHDPEHALRMADKVLLLQRDGDYVFGAPREALNDATLSCLYGVPLSLVDVKTGAGECMQVIARAKVQGRELSSL